MKAIGVEARQGRRWYMDDAWSMEKGESVEHRAWHGERNAAAWAKEHGSIEDGEWNMATATAMDNKIIGLETGAWSMEQ